MLLYLLHIHYYIIYDSTAARFLWILMLEPQRHYIHMSVCACIYIYIYMYIYIYIYVLHVMYVTIQYITL